MIFKNFFHATTTYHITADVESNKVKSAQHELSRFASPDRVDLYCYSFVKLLAVFVSFEK